MRASANYRLQSVRLPEESEENRKPNDAISRSLEGCSLADFIFKTTNEEDVMTRMTLRWFAFLCGAILVLIGASSTHAKTAQEIARKAFDSTVLIVMELSIFKRFDTLM